MPVNKPQYSKLQGGFTLIEVLVAVVVLSIGVLGLIALESNTLRNNQTAYYRSQATILIYDMADKMRANMEVDYSGITSSSSANDCVFYSETDSLSGCGSATEIAKKQLYDWEQLIATTLPLGQGSVTTSGAVTTVNVAWDDDRDGSVDTDPANGEAFEMSFEL